MVQNVVMSNAAFRELGSDLGKQLIHFATSNNIHVERVKFEVEKNKPPHWFDINKFSLPKSSVQYALDVTEIVRAQQAQKNFVQTLTKTFATLSIGLAIFDRNRQLMLFNPALIDLTTLPADFLSARPNLLTVFDKLRDNQIMPEPKNYATWREKLAILVAAATEGTYTEIWNLPTGATFRISGRPHPDGALAFLFEDITAEVSMSRRFTVESELHRELLNNLDGAIAIFSISGELYHQNEAHANLWGGLSTDPETRSTIKDASKLWQSRSKPTGLWGEIRDFVNQIDEREGWREDIIYETSSALAYKLSLLWGSIPQFVLLTKVLVRQISNCHLLFMANSRTVQFDSPEQTAIYAAKLANNLAPEDIILLNGDVGAGKSYFCRALIQAVLQYEEDIPSPTFTLVQQYDTEIGELWHADLYRLNDPPKS